MPDRITSVPTGRAQSSFFLPQGQFQLSCELLGLSFLSEAEAVVGEKVIRPVMVAGVWALRLSPHSSSTSIPVDSGRSTYQEEVGCDSSC